MSKDDQHMALEEFINKIYGIQSEQTEGILTKLHKNSSNDMMMLEFTTSEGKKWRGYAFCIGDVKEET